MVETLLGEKRRDRRRMFRSCPKLEGARQADHAATLLKSTRVTQNVLGAMSASTLMGLHWNATILSAVGEKKTWVASRLTPPQSYETAPSSTGSTDYAITFFPKRKTSLFGWFCRRLLGYALGRAVTLSDSATIDQMLKSLERDEVGVQSLVKTIIATTVSAGSRQEK